jgi:hypothetical protein
MNRALTRVRLISLPQRCRVILRFGLPFFEEDHSKHQRHVYFAPHTVFSTLRWHGNEYGTILWQLSILRAASPWETATRIADVDPGAEVLLRVSGKANVRRILVLVRQIEAQRINPAEVSPHYWRTVQNRITGRDVLPEYTRDSHAAYLNRLRILA